MRQFLSKSGRQLYFALPGRGCRRQRTDPIADGIRATKDVDAVVEATTLSQYHRMEKQLPTLGFARDAGSEVICRWRHPNTVVGQASLRHALSGVECRHGRSNGASDSAKCCATIIAQPPDPLRLSF